MTYFSFLQHVETVCTPSLQFNDLNAVWLDLSNLRRLVNNFLTILYQYVRGIYR